MKTISLTDEADQKLKSWKTEPSESFSKVVLKAVPERGTAAKMEQGFKRLPTLTQKQSEAMGAALAWASDWPSCADLWATPSVDADTP
jgi:predicted CopG family antitoxin